MSVLGGRFIQIITQTHTFGKGTHEAWVTLDFWSACFYLPGCRHNRLVPPCPVICGTRNETQSSGHARLALYQLNYLLPIKAEQLFLIALRDNSTYWIFSGPRRKYFKAVKTSSWICMCTTWDTSGDTYIHSYFLSKESNWSKQLSKHLQRAGNPPPPCLTHFLSV